ncbi:MAG TPA: potassium transporter Kup [Thermoanaerobaculia bacterium]|nr:potassium transporter Kup [Thermoanaerobaculia bacterium]
MAAAVPSGRRLFLLCLSALGVVYGDIGTSPLYALKVCFSGLHAIPLRPENVLGILSLVFWSLVVIVTVKYHVYVLRLDNRGEGGILALMGLVRGGKTGRRVRMFLVTVGVFGAALLYGDGIITPAISVLSAVEGLHVATPVFGAAVVPITVVILVGLFLFEKRGTASIGRIFGPVMLVWFSTLALLGVSGILRHPGVVAALNPAHAVSFFARNRFHGFLVLGAIFLVATGGEALYADLGHFGEKPIQIDWFSFVGPALVLNYFGQGALLISSPAAAENPFYLLAPGWALYPLVLLATMATIIASQAIISGAFSLTRQAVQLGYLPRVRIVHTSPEEIGQIYIPGLNWVLMLSTIGLVLGFRTSNNLAAAYGVAVSMTMVITTVLAYFVARDRLHWKTGIAFLVTVLFLVFDLSFLGANLVKVWSGGWFPLVVALVVFAIMTTWRRGRRLLNVQLRRRLCGVEQFIADAEKGKPVRVPGTGVYMSMIPDVIPPALLNNFRHNHVLQEQVVLLTILTEDVPRVRERERVKVEKFANGFFRIVIHFGFMEDPDLIRTLRKVKAPGLALELSKATFFLGKETILPSEEHPGMALWREKLFSIMSNNSRSATAFFSLPPEQVMEIRGQVQI